MNRKKKSKNIRVKDRKKDEKSTAIMINNEKCERAETKNFGESLNVSPQKKN